MNRIRRIRRVATALAGLALTWLGLAAAAPAAFASPIPPSGDDVTGGSGAVTTIRTVVIGGMPGWQIVLIATCAALLAATFAVLIDHRGRGTSAWTPRGAQAGSPARAADLAAPVLGDSERRPAQLVTGARRG